MKAIHYYKTKLVKMGQWATPPLDVGTWHRLESSKLFKKYFGVHKGLLFLFEAHNSQMHVYAPTDFLKRLRRLIDQINSHDAKTLTLIFLSFYPLRAKAEKAVAKIYDDALKLSDKGLADAIIKVRREVHEVTVFDQFSWLAEEYWTPKMREVLEKKLKLTHESPEYNATLFALTKPAELSTTLREKLAVTEEALALKSKKSVLNKSARRLALLFGWMPIFTWGDAWTEAHYEKELQEVIASPINELQKQANDLKNYKSIRKAAIDVLVKKYSIGKRDLQIFADFGLAIDTRNEAEYFVSFAGQYLMPLFREAAKRLFLSSTQLRSLTDEELNAILRGKIKVEKFPHLNAKYRGFGYQKKMDTLIDFTPQEAELLFLHVKSRVKMVQGGDEKKGMCASPGKARGKIRIVPSPDQNSKVKQGDILVTYSTTTDYLPAMKRASAIITEVGGMTCHAAVVSREFGIPCIVALSNAMKNFKDGQMVEVDANKGIVKKV